MHRSRALLVHAAFSLAVLAVAAWVLVRVYYPYGLLGAMGATRAALATAACFLLLGPGLTAVLYRPGKRGLAIDVVLIALLQIGAGIAGGFVLWHGRPAFLVFAVDRVAVVAANELSDDDLESAADPAYSSRPVAGPLFVAVDRPTDPELATSILFAALQHGKDIDRYPHFYAAIARHWTEIARAIRDPAQIRAATPVAPGIGYLPLVARERDQMLLVSRSDGAILGFDAADPWPNRGP